MTTAFEPLLPVDKDLGNRAGIRRKDKRGKNIFVSAAQQGPVSQIDRERVELRADLKAA